MPSVALKKNRCELGPSCPPLLLSRGSSRADSVDLFCFISPRVRTLIKAVDLDQANLLLSQQQLQLRHWLLMMLRTLALSGCCLAAAASGTAAPLKPHLVFVMADGTLSCPPLP